MAERWSRLRPRARFALVLALLGLTVTGLTARLASSPWGEPVPVLIATRTLDTGEALTLISQRGPDGGRVEPSQAGNGP